MSKLAVIEQNAITIAFQKPSGINDLFEKIKAQAQSIVPDITTKKGRDAIASNALKVSKSKVMVDNFRKDLVADEKKRLKLIDDECKVFRDNCDALRDLIRKPLTDWENAEEDRVTRHKAFVMSFTFMSAPAAFENRDSIYIKQLIEEVESAAITNNLQEFEEPAKLAKFEALEKLRDALVNREKYEFEQAELIRLKAEAIERERIAHEKAIADHAASKARAEAEAIALAEKKAMQLKAANAEREQARLIAEAENAKLREAAAKQAAIDAAKKAEIDKLAAIESERLRIEHEDKQRKEQLARDEKQRLENHEYVRKINRAALDSLINEAKITEEQGQLIIKLIAAKKIPYISIQY